MRRLSRDENPPSGLTILVRRAFQKGITEFYDFKARALHFLPCHFGGQLVMFDLLVSGLRFAAIPDTLHEKERSARLQRCQRMAQHGLIRCHLVVSFRQACVTAIEGN
jgi:hypothetical protein